MLHIKEIQEAVPHRYPFLLVDRIIEVSADGRKAVGIKNVSINEPFFQGHFPICAIMPGVLIVEALAQTAAAGLLGEYGRQGKMGVLGGLDRVKFRRLVVPGDQLRLEVEITKMRGVAGKMFGRATVDGEMAAEGEITFAIVDIPK